MANDILKDNQIFNSINIEKLQKRSTAKFDRPDNVEDELDVANYSRRKTMAEGLSKNFNSNQNDRLKPPKAPNSQHISELTVQDIPRDQLELLRNSL